MRTVMRKPVLASMLIVLGGVFLGAGAASADVTSDRAAAILVWPKLLFSGEGDTNNTLSFPGQTVDTTIQLTNTSDQEVHLRCFYVNANSHCSNDASLVCGNHADCNLIPPGGGRCEPGWVEVDFEINLSPYQPLVWTLGTGMASLPCSDTPCSTPGTGAPFENAGNIPPASEDPFMGELKCIQVGENNEPIDRNDVKGEATIVSVGGPSAQGIDARGYNAIGIQAIPGAVDGDNTLRLGEEYNGCPNVLILDHFFDDAVEPRSGDSVKTHLTLVPCSQDFELQAPTPTTFQLLVYNEFEQRFSASRNVTCFQEFELCSLGTGRERPLNAPGAGDPNYQSCQRSVFSAYVSGTLTGQTRIRAVESDDFEHGQGLIGVAEEFHRSIVEDVRMTNSSAAYNIHFVGERTKADIMRLP